MPLDLAVAVVVAAAAVVLVLLLGSLPLSAMELKSL